MGNMSSPNINRWGLNLFWYRFWYNDKINALINQQDYLINRFVYIYVHYGLLCSKNFFIHKYWYLNLAPYLQIFKQEIYTKYFRVAEYRNKLNKEIKIYKLRIKIKNLHYTKLWILRYQNWLVINFYWFQPLKKKKKKLRKLNKSAGPNLIKQYTNYFTLVRYRLILMLFLNFFSFKNIYYKF